MQGVQPRAKARQVIAVEMQGPGRTADTDRLMSFPTMGDDIAGLEEYLQIPKADLVGDSSGGASAIRGAIQHAEKVRRMVVTSSRYAKSGCVSRGAAWHEPGRRSNGRKHNADADWQVFKAMA